MVQSGIRATGQHAILQHLEMLRKTYALGDLKASSGVREWKLRGAKWKVRTGSNRHDCTVGAERRPPGVSSRIRRVRGPRQAWTTTEGVTVDLPVIVDWVSIEPGTGDEAVRVESRVDMVGGQPAIVEMVLTARDGLDVVALQRDFRWASPLEVVTGVLPRLIAAGEDPFSAELPVAGFPAAAFQPVSRRGTLTDEFLTTIAREYLARGRGYARSLAAEYFVTPRAVVSWVEKARARGLLSAPPARGATGGRLIEKQASRNDP